VFYSLTLVRVN